jgi:aminoglycoside 2''-phosphotransferase
VNQDKSLAIFSLLPPFYENPPHQDVNVYLQKIEKEFSIKINKYRYIKDAFDHDVFIINKEIVFRFPRTQRETEILNYEINFLNFLKDKVKVNIPKYSYVSKNSEFAGYKIIPGKILSPLTFKYFSKKKKVEVIKQLVEFINVFHKIDVKEFDKYKPRQRKDFIILEQRVEKELEDKLFPMLPKNEVTIIKDFYNESKKYFQEIPSFCATHGDLYAFNTIWNKEKSEIGIIDFSDLLIGDPAKDFEVFYDYGSEYAEMAYERYTGPKDNNFLRRGEIYYKLHAIYTLLSSQLGALISFEHSHMRFQQKFNLV